MIESREHAIDFTRGMELAAFVADARTRSAVQREVFVLGEAAKRIPPEVRGRQPAIDWKGLAGLRDILAHQYFRIDDAIVWDVVRNELPRLLPLLRGLVEAEP
jgi:uncharacterized protein with HEPN domain